MAVSARHALPAALLLLAALAHAQHGEQHFHRSFDDAEKWSKIFDDPARDAWQKPAQVIRALALRPFLNNRAAKEGLPNVSSHRAGESDPNLLAPVDLVLVVDTYHHIAQRSAYFERLKAKLKPGGGVAIIDFRPEAPSGPPPEHRIAPSRVVAEMDKAGYALTGQHDFLPNQYFLVFAPR